MSYVGVVSLYLAVFFGVSALILSLLTLREKKQRIGLMAGRAGALSTLCILTATLGLVVAFLINDFSIAYVSRHSARNLPVLYKVSALWAGQSGSLLLWVLILSSLTFVVQRVKRYQKDDLGIRLGIVMQAVCLVFLLLLLFIATPFERLTTSPYDGSGLNPMLQSLGMVFHPPLLFLGFSGFLVPFAFAVVGLWTNDLEGDWLGHVMKWVLFSWLFLTAGIVTGGQWAYNELGWGGYWAWDPVENSSFFPWLTSTALLHILCLPLEHSTRRVWSYILIVITYGLTIFATFLTRSGILDSVHAFAGGVLGQAFLAVLLILLVFSLVLGWSRRRVLVSTEKGDTNYESSGMAIPITLGSILLLMLCAGVFFGTMFPVLSRLFAAREVVLDRGFFNQLSVPLFLAILFLMSLSPLLRKEVSGRVWIRRLALPVLSAVAVGIYAYSIEAGGIGTLAFALAAFGIVSHVPILLQFRSLRRWGGGLVHLGVLIVMVGVTGSSIFVEDIHVSVNPGQEIVLGEYTLQYEGLKAQYGSDRYHVGTTLKIMDDGLKRGEITSVKTFWEGRSQPSTKVGIFSTFKEDLYLNLAGWEQPVAQLHLQRFALVRWIWVGSWMIYGGALVTLLADLKFRFKGRQVRLWSRQMR